MIWLHLTHSHPKRRPYKLILAADSIESIADAGPELGYSKCTIVKTKSGETWYVEESAQQISEFVAKAGTSRLG